MTLRQAFVVHVTGMGPGGESDLEGRVEHVATGARAQFGSSTELARLIRQLLAEQKEDEQ